MLVATLSGFRVAKPNERGLDMPGNPTNQDLSDFEEARS